MRAIEVFAWYLIGCYGFVGHRKMYGGIAMAVGCISLQARILLLHGKRLVLSYIKLNAIIAHAHDMES